MSGGTHRATCVICGISWAYTPHRENTAASDHISASHPDVKKSIPIRDLIRVEENGPNAE